MGEPKTEKNQTEFIYFFSSNQHTKQKKVFL